MKDISIGDTIYYKFKQKSPYSNKGIVVKIYGRGKNRKFEVGTESGLVFLDEIFKFEKTSK